MLIINPYLLQLHLVNMCFFNDILVLGFQIGIFYPAICLVVFWLLRLYLQISFRFSFYMRSIFAPESIGYFHF